MNTPHDLKSLGLPTTHPPMSRRTRNFVAGCLFVIAACTGYLVAADTADRKAVDINVTMTSTEYAEALDRARKQGEADTLKRLRSCGWRDTFRDEPPLKKWSKT